MPLSEQRPAPFYQNQAMLSFDTKNTKLHVKVNITPAGLMAIGFLVSAILLSVAPIVRASGEVVRERPISPARSLRSDP